MHVSGAHFHTRIVGCHGPLMPGCLRLARSALSARTGDRLSEVADFRRHERPVSTGLPGSACSQAADARVPASKSFPSRSPAMREADFA